MLLLKILMLFKLSNRKFIQAMIDLGRELLGYVTGRCYMRAIKVYEKAGFHTKTFMQDTNGGTYEFLRMVY